MQSRRKVNRFKVIIVALLINLIDYRINTPQKPRKESLINKSPLPPKGGDDLVWRLENVQVTAAEFNKLKMSPLKDKLTKIIIPEGVKVIKDSCFEDFRKLQTVAIPNTVKIIESHAFDTTNLTRISIPKSVTKIERYAFFTVNRCKSWLWKTDLQKLMTTHVQIVPI